MRTMYDGVTVSGLPEGAPLYAGYLDGRYANLPALRKRFPSARIVEIAVFASTLAGHVLDVETGDATPAESVGWVRARRKAGADPTVYCNTSTWPAVRAAFRAAGVAEPHYWLAAYNGSATIPAGAVAHQWRNTAHYDQSVVADYWPGVDPHPTEEDDMALSAEDKTWLTGMVDARIKAALPAIAAKVAEEDGLYAAPADREDKKNGTWSLKAMVQNTNEKVTALLAAAKKG